MLSDHKLEKTATHFGLTEVMFWHLLETRWTTTHTHKNPCVPGKIQTGYLPNTIATCAIFLSPFQIYFISVLGDRHGMCHCKSFTSMHSSYEQKSDWEIRKHRKGTDFLQMQRELFNTVMRKQSNVVSEL
jgi:hypothetical protein